VQIRSRDPELEFVRVRRGNKIQMVQLERIHKAPSNAIYYVIIGIVVFLATIYIAR